MTDAVSLKRFFKKHFGIPVRVSTGTGKSRYIEARIAPVKTARHTDPLRYDHQYPAELGNQCLRIVYPNSPGLHEQNWGGNISAHMIVMRQPEWEQLIAAVEGQVETPA